MSPAVRGRAGPVAEPAAAAPRHQPRKRFGQHFLRDTNQINRIIATIAPQAAEHCLEIGPGDGALTAPLAGALTEGRLDCVELDRELARRLQSRFAEQAHVRVHCRDVLKLDLAELGANPGGLRVVGNLPYNISTPVLFHLLEMADWIKDMTFMLQREVVQRMTATAGNRNYGRLSVMLGYSCAVQWLFDVPPEVFRPRPKVHSALVRLRPRPPPLRAANEACFAKVVRAAFSQRRKTLRNSLKSVVPAELLEQLPVDLGARPEQLDLTDYARISNAISGSIAP